MGTGPRRAEDDWHRRDFDFTLIYGDAEDTIRFSHFLDAYVVRRRVATLMLILYMNFGSSDARAALRHD